MDTKSNKDPEIEESDPQCASNVHRELAIKGAEMFDRGELAASLEQLAKLQEQRPLDTRFVHNAAVVMFLMRGFRNVEEFRKQLNSICSQVNLPSFTCYHLIDDFDINLDYVINRCFCRGRLI